MGPVYVGYSKAVADPKSKVSVRKYLKKLRSYGLVEFEGPKYAREYVVEEDVAELVE